jgi:Ca2+-binding RTX toxin-like protein
MNRHQNKVKNIRSSKRSKPKTYRPSFEVLERRIVLAADVTFNIDYTPDVLGPPDNVIPQDFSQIFSLDYWRTELQLRPVNSQPWAVNQQRLLGLLDYNRDGTLSEKDQKGDPTAATALGRYGAERAILVGVRSDFDSIASSLPGVDVSFRRVTSGWDQLTQSQPNSAGVDTYVLFVGNQNPNPPATGLVFGRAFQAPPNRNSEYYGYIYGGEVVKRMLQQSGPSVGRSWTPLHFTNFVVSSSSHEFGHQLGLGHVLREVTKSDGTKEYVSSTTTNSLMSYGRVRWNNVATFNNREYSFVEVAGSSTPGSQNAALEVRNSLGLIGQTTRALIGNTPQPKFHDSGELEDFGFINPVRSLPAASSGTVGSTTAENIASSFSAGLNAVRTELTASIASKLNLPGSQLPLVTTALSDALGLTTKLQNSVAAIDLSGINTLAALVTKLQASGYTIDETLTDAELANLRNNSPNSSTDFIRASQTIRLLDLAGSSALNNSAISALGDLVGVNFSGSLDALANIALHLTLGVDTAGFYIASGLILDAPISLSGELTATLGSFGKAVGEGAVDIRGAVQLNATSADGRVRIAQMVSSVAPATIEGVAGLDLSFSATVGGQSIDLGGDWIWNVEAGSFALDASNSGFDEDLLLDSLTELVGDGVDGFFSAANDLGNIAREIPVIGSSLSSKLTSSLASLVDLTSTELTFAERLSEAGFTFTLGAGITPRSFVDGSYVTSTNLLEVTYNKTYTPDIPAYEFSGAIDIGTGINGKLDGRLSINGDPASTADDSKIALSLGFGIDVESGPYLKEGSYVELIVSPKLAMTGELNLGKLTTITADAVANIALTSRVLLDDGNASTNKIFLSRSDSSQIDSIVQSKDALSVSGIAGFGLSLKAKNPAANIAFLGIGDAIKEALTTPTNPNGELEWTADASISFRPVVGGFESTSSFNVTSTEAYLKNIFENVQEKLFKNTFLAEVEKYNPFPSEFRKLVTSEIPFLENRSLASLTGLDALEILLAEDPKTAVGSSSEVEGNGIDVKFDILDFQQISNLLSGKNANLISLVVDKSFRLAEFNVPIITETLLASYFGIVNFTGQLDLVGDVDFNVDFVASLDTEGFYLQEKADVVSITSSLGIRPTLRARLTAVEFARIEGTVAFELIGAVGFTGGVDGKVREVAVPDILSIRADLVFDLDGMVGFPEVGLSNRFDIYDRRLKLFDATYKSESLNTGANGFPEARSKMQKELDKIGLCGGAIAASAFIPGVNIGVAAVACGIAYSDQIVQALEDAGEWVGDRWEDLSDSAADAEKEVRDWAKERVNVLEKEAAKLEEKARGIIRTIPGGGYVLDRLGSVATFGEDFFNTIFNGGSRRTERSEVAVEPIFSFITPGLSQPKVVNGELIVRWNEDRDGKMHIDTLPSGQIIISSDALPPVRTLVGYEQDKKRVWVADGFNSGYRWLDDGDRRELFTDYVHSNVFLSKENEVVNRIVVIGGAKNDFISVSQRMTKGVEISGMGGNDRINGGSGNDIIFGGDGEDRISGGLGNDVIDGGENADTIDERPGSGNRNSERNTIRGGGGDDIIYGSPGVDIVFGERGEDQIKGGSGDDDIDGGDDADRIDGESGNDTIRGGLAGDILIGGIGTDLIFGGAGNDQIDGGEDRDILHGEDDSDRIAGGGGNDDIFGGAGADVINGGLGNDVIYGATRDNENDARDGNDVIYGEGGNDTIYAGPGGPGLPNMPSGGENRNYIDGGADTDTIFGGDGPDYISGGDGDDIIGARDGDDVIIGHLGSDTIDAGPGEDTVHASVNPTTKEGSTVNGGSGKDFIIGSSGFDTLNGGDGDDEIHAGFEDDVIDGGDGNDKLVGNGEKDRISGGVGDDTMTGMLGDDTFIGGDGYDTVVETGDVDFSLTNTTLSGLGFDTLNTIEKAILTGGTSNNSFTVSSWTHLAELDALAGSDRYTVNLIGGPDGIVVIKESGGDNSVDAAFVNGTSRSDFIESTASRVTLEGQQVFYDRNLEKLDINGMNSDDRILVLDTWTDTATRVNGNDGDDTIEVASTRTADNGSLDKIESLLTVVGGAGFDRAFVNDHGTNGPMNYLLTPEKLVDLPSSLIKLDKDKLPPRTAFAGITIDPSLDYLKLDANDRKNVFRVQPSESTEFDIAARLPRTQDRVPNFADFLSLDIQTSSAISRIPADPKVTFTEIVDGMQQAGFWSFAAHKPVNFSSIERFNLLDKLSISSDAAWTSSSGVGVSSPVVKAKYSNLVTNFTSLDLVPFSLSEFPSPTVAGKNMLSNFLIPSDVNNDGFVSPLDALVVITHLNMRSGVSNVGSSSGFLDVNNDGNISPIDALIVINTLNRDARPSVTFGGVRTTSADLNFDGVDEVLAVSGANHIPTLLVFNGVTGQLMGSPQPLTTTTDNFGTNVAAGDIDGDGSVEIITSSDRGPGTYSIWRWENGLISKISDRIVEFSAGYLGGVRVATGDLNGDGKSEIIVGSGTGTDASVRAYDANGFQLSSFIVAPSFERGGVYVATGDYNGDGRSDLFVSSGRRGNAQIQIFDGVAVLGNSISVSHLISNAYTNEDAIAPISIALKDSDGDEEKELYSSQLSDGRSDQLKKWEFSKLADAFFSTLQSELDPDWSSGAYLG